NYPNPFNPETTISFSFPKSDNISLEIFNIKGQLVETLITDYREAGKHSIIWDAKNINSGIYFYRLQTADFTEMKKCILVK
ncbi:MAG: T9SS type A sorting domain-containing protein, partial [Candidatus Cloacimonetes bacterium]|nr:T9SS type A sorting domain-containing protein [Candidatus Cloacimonadota bacterium]